MCFRPVIHKSPDFNFRECIQQETLKCVQFPEAATGGVL